MSEALVPDPIALAQELAAKHRQEQQVAAVHDFVDVTNPASMDDFQQYLESRPHKDEKGNIHDPTNGKFTGQNGEYFDAQRQKHYDETLKETVVDYESMTMPQLAREMGKAEAKDDKPKFAELDGVLSQKVETFADSVKTDRNPNGLPDESREALHARMGKIREQEKARLTKVPTEPKEEPKDPESKDHGKQDDVEIVGEIAHEIRGSCE